jgi:hypothetical protein
MTSELSVEVEVKGSKIIVTRPGTRFSATYQKPAGQPQLRMLTSTAERVDKDTIYRFRAEAFQAALKKARELSWIV